MKLDSLRDLYLDQLRDLYSAEVQLVRALPELAEAAAHPELKKAFEEHLAATKRHRERLEKIFTGLGAAPTGHTCRAMQGLVAEAEELLGHRAGPAVRDAGLIAAAQRVEHYEIAGYGTVATYAEMLDRRDDHDLLGLTLDEEKATDERLTRIAKQIVNLDATVA